ncbi:MAG: hydrolase TatD [Thermoprotei archaeon]|nr:MAG: hydrolase TatD [Thermoprotei archaeon]
MLYADAHCHSNPVRGLGARTIAKKFKNVGGWFIALVSLPPYYYGFTKHAIEAYEKTLEVMASEKKKVAETGVKVKLLAGFHPAEVDEYIRRGLKPEEVLELADNVFKLIVKLHKEGLVDGIGEVGRQHYSTATPRLVLSELIMIKALEVAKDYDLPIHLHLEQGGRVTVESVKTISRLTGLNTKLILLHHASSETSYWSSKYGLWHTVVAKKNLIRITLGKKHDKLMVESDYIDDPRRPGVASYPWDIAFTINELVESGAVSEEEVYRTMVDRVTTYYGVEAP